jgi:hypothetical protein
MAQPFAVARLALHGEARLVADNVSYSPVIGFSDFSVSDAGVLAYLPTAAPWRLTWFDRSGRSIAAFGAAGAYQQISLSPDGTRVATEGYPKLETSYELFHRSGRAEPTQLTFGAPRAISVWSPDGSTIAFGSNRAGHYDIYQTGWVSPRAALSDRNKFLAWTGRATGDGFVGRGGSDRGEGRSGSCRNGGDRKPVRLPADADHRADVFLRCRFVATPRTNHQHRCVEAFPAGRGRFRPAGTIRDGADGREQYHLSPRRTDGCCITLAPRFTPKHLTKLFDTWIRSYLANFDVSAGRPAIPDSGTGRGLRPTPMNVLISWQRS